MNDVTLKAFNMRLKLYNRLLCTATSSALIVFSMPALSEDGFEPESVTNRIESVEKDVSVINERLGRSARPPTQANSIEKRLGKIEKDISSIQKELEKMGEKVSTLESKVKSLERNQK